MINKSTNISNSVNERTQQQEAHVRATTSPTIDGGIVAEVDRGSSGVVRMLLNISRLDEKLYWIPFDEAHPTCDICSDQFTPYAVTPAQTQVRQNGKNEIAYRCGAWDLDEGITWLDIGADRLGKQDQQKAYPVFVTAPAYRRACRFAKRFCDDEGLLRNHLWLSLEQATFTRISHGAFAAECIVAGQRLGVFTGRVIEENFVIFDYTADCDRSDFAEKDVEEITHHLRSWLDVASSAFKEKEGVEHGYE